VHSPLIKIKDLPPRSTRDAVLDCCIEQEFMRDGELVKESEFNLIFGSIFRESEG
jgi:hypothetical protein